MSLALPAAKLAPLYVERLRPVMTHVLDENLKTSDAEAKAMLLIETNGEELNVSYQLGEASLKVDPRLASPQIKTISLPRKDLLRRYLSRAEGVLAKAMLRNLRSLDSYSVARFRMTFQHGLLIEMDAGIVATYEASIHPQLKSAPRIAPLG